MPSCVPLLLFFALLAAVVVVKPDPDLGFVSSFCGKQTDPDPPQLRDRAIEVTGMTVDLGNPDPTGFCGAIEIEPFIYAFASCPADVAQVDCTTCLRYARSQLLDNLCKDRYGAQVTLNGCFMRYETYKFCGEE